MNRTVSFFIFTVILLLGAASGVRAETTAYIANGGVGEVIRVIIDSQATDETDMTGSPYGCAVTPDGSQVLVTRADENAVSFIDTGDFSGIHDDMDVGGSPRGVAVEPNGNYAYVANYDTDEVIKIFVNSRSISETIEVGDGPLGVAAHYDDDRNTPIAYVTCHDDDSVWVVDNDGTTTISVGDGPTGIAVTPAGDYVYVSNTFSDTVSVIDTAENEVVDTIGVGHEPWGVAVGGDGGYVFVTNSADNSVTVIQSPAHTILGTYQVNGTPRGVAAPKNGNYAYVVHQSGDFISVIDMDADEKLTEIIVDSLDEAYGIGAFIGDAPPDRPTGLTATAKSETAIDISWADNNDREVGFKIERSKKDEEHYVQIATVSEDTTTYEDHGLSSDTVYYYRVRAYVDAADSGYSGSAEATTVAYSGSIWCFIGAMAGP